MNQETSNHDDTPAGGPPGAEPESESAVQLPAIDLGITSDLQIKRHVPSSVAGPSIEQLDDSVVYLCSCGDSLVVDPDQGGECGGCGALVSAKALQHDLALTMTMHADDLPEIEVGEIRSGEFDSELAETLIGQTLGHFEIISLLGRGGCGQVYRALDTSLQRYVAVKVLKSGIGSNSSTIGSSGSSEREIDMLLQEAVSQARVTHPNIVTIYYVGRQDGAPFLAMELVSGYAVSERLENGALSFDEIAPVAIQVVQALKFSFELDIIHGDIKPSNIMMQVDGVTKISDFGMARRVSKDSGQGVGGTPNYIAPELLRGHKPSVQSDMYSLGVSLYETTFGQLPINLVGSSPSEWIQSHQEQSVQFPNPWPENLPDGWLDILQTLLRKDPGQRFKNYQELQDALESVRPGSRTVAKSAPRLVAAVIDWVTVFLLMAPVQLSMQSFGSFFQQHGVLGFLWTLVDFVPIVVYTILLLFWRQSIGRELMQLRVVNRHGMRASGRLLAFRSAIRMIIPWFSCVMFVLGSTFANVATLSLVAFVIGVSCWWTDLGFMIFSRSGRALHDRIFKTQVVLDTH